mgnify:CR=1 FL=1|tara:strand:- start:8231 stop:8824 length:594 start_codon:yes stop_codon:yes gene_type:complete
MRKILSDCDGVLLDWNSSFEKWAKFHFGMEVADRTTYSIKDRFPGGDHQQYLDYDHAMYLPRIFCNSSRMATLKPMRDAVLYTKKLYEEFGTTIDVITSYSLDPESIKLRESNLRTVFGPCIDRIICIDTGISKKVALEEWRDSGLMWVEDKTSNVIRGTKMGLDSVVFDQPYNRDYQGEAPRVKNWKEIYEIVAGV